MTTEDLFGPEFASIADNVGPRHEERPPFSWAAVAGWAQEGTAAFLRAGFDRDEALHLVVATMGLLGRMQ